MCLLLLHTKQKLTSELSENKSIKVDGVCGYDIGDFFVTIGAWIMDFCKEDISVSNSSFKFLRD